MPTKQGKIKPMRETAKKAAKVIKNPQNKQECL